MKFLTKIICRFAEHQWGNWEYHIAGSCEQRRLCRWCPSVELRAPVHTLGEFTYSNETSCNRQRTCDRCNHIQPSGVKHRWGSFHYFADGECRQQKVCTRCGEVEEGTLTHDWGPWTRSEDSSCDRGRYCIRCGYDDPSVDFEHDWLRGDIITMDRTYHPVSRTHVESSYEEIHYRCSRCGVTKIEYETWEYHD
jgi:hypothetical protein